MEKAPKQFLQVLYDFKAQEAVELTVEKGDIVVAWPVEHQDPDSGWIQVETFGGGTVRSGFVPEGYVEPLTPDEAERLVKEKITPKSSPQGEPTLPATTATPIPQSQPQQQPSEGALFLDPFTEMQASTPASHQEHSSQQLPQHQQQQQQQQQQPQTKTPPRPPSPTLNTAGDRVQAPEVDLQGPVTHQQFPTGSEKLGKSEWALRSETPLAISPSHSASLDPPLHHAFGGGDAGHLVSLPRPSGSYREPSASMGSQGGNNLVESFMKNEVYFRSLMKQRQETFQKLDACIGETAQEVALCKEKNQLLARKIRELDHMIEEDRAKWRQRVEEEKKLLLSQTNTNFGAFATNF